MKMDKMNKEKEIYYYKDELVDDFATMENIKVVNVDENYRFIHKNPIWNIASILTQNVLSMPVKYLYAKIKFDIKFVGREKLKKAKKRGYFIYANHTQIFADTFIPSLANYPKRNFFIVDPANISMPGLKLLVRLLGAFPLPSNLKAYKNFLNAIKLTIENKHSITIYPEAHIWPYYTKIRNFKAVSFKYPVEFAGFNNDAAQGRSVAADKLGGGMHHDIRAVLNRPDQIRRTEGVVNHQRKPVPVGNLRNRVNVRNVAVRIPQRLQVNRPGILPDRLFHFLQVVGVHKGGFNAVLRQRMRQQVEASAVDRFLCDDMAAVCGKGLDRIGNGSST